MITNSGRITIAQCFMGDSTKRLAKIGFGTSDTPATEFDTYIENGYIRDVVNLRIATTEDKLLVDWRLEPEESNDIIIKEVALYASDNTLVARKVIEPVVKNADLLLTGLWEVNLTLNN